MSSLFGRGPRARRATADRAGPSGRASAQPAAPAAAGARFAGAGREGLALLGVTDVLAPSSATLRPDWVALERELASVVAVRSYPRYLYPGWFGALSDLDIPQLEITLHLRPRDSLAMLRALRRRLTELDASRRLDARAGRLPDPEREVAAQDLSAMIERLQRAEDRIFDTSLYLMARAGDGSVRTLEQRRRQVESALGARLLGGGSATFEQDLAFRSCLPLGRDELRQSRQLDCGTLATAFPFIASTLGHPEGILYGVVPQTSSPIILDPFSPALENANMVVFAQSGAGKSYFCKLLALRALLVGTAICIIDPEPLEEYAPICQATGGEYLRLSPEATQHINPFDVPAPERTARWQGLGAADAAAPDPLAERFQALQTFLELLLAERRPDGGQLTSREKGVLDAALRQAATAAPERAAVVVLDPHGDLVQTLLARVPADVASDAVQVVDLADRAHPVGLNPLDVTLGRDRDKAVENLLLIFAQIWRRFWGPRMENALEYALKTLYEANGALVAHDPARGPDQQFTLLDVAPLLLEDSFRHRVLPLVRDEELLRWWARYYELLDWRMRQEIINPVLTKMAKFAGARVVRRIVGQGRTTLDVAAIVRSGQVLLVNTARGAVGSDTAALVGATVLGLLRVALEEQVRAPAAERHRVRVLVDEFQTLPGVDFGALLAELRKFGASFVLATQTVSGLQTQDRDLWPTILANIANLFVFQSSAGDARLLLPELDDVASVRDLTNLPDFTCYAKLASGRDRLPVFSFTLASPPAGLPGRADELLAASRARIAPRTAPQIDAQLAALAERHTERSRLQAWAERAGASARTPQRPTPAGLRSGRAADGSGQPRRAGRARAGAPSSEGSSFVEAFAPERAVHLAGALPPPCAAAVETLLDPGVPGASGMGQSDRAAPALPSAPPEPPPGEPQAEASPGGRPRLGRSRGGKQHRRGPRARAEHSEHADRQEPGRLADAAASPPERPAGEGGGLDGQA